MRSTQKLSQLKQPNQREPKKKRTLEEQIHKISDGMMAQAREERIKPLREKWKKAEDEIAAMTFGPNWRDPEPRSYHAAPESNDVSEPSDDDQAAE